MERHAIATLPFLYNASYRAHGHSRATTAPVKGAAPFTLLSVSSADAPLATVRWRSPFKDERSSGSVPSPSDPDAVATRTYRGVSYVALGSSLADNEGKPVLLADMEADLARGGFARWSAYDLPAMPLDDPRRPDVVGRPTEDRFSRRVASFGRLARSTKVSDDREAQIPRSAKAWEEGLLLVDGEVWTRPPGRTEPFYVVDVGRDRVALDWCVCPDDLPAAPRALFAANERLAAVEFAVAIAADNGLPFEDCGVDLGVVDECALAFDPWAFTASQVAGELALLTVTHGRLTGAGAALADACEAYSDDPDPANVAAIMDALGPALDEAAPDQSGLPFDATMRGSPLLDRMVPFGLARDLWAARRPTRFVEIDDEIDGLAVSFGA